MLKYKDIDTAISDFLSKNGLEKYFYDWKISDSREKLLNPYKNIDEESRYFFVPREEAREILSSKISKYNDTNLLDNKFTDHLIDFLQIHKNGLSNVYEKLNDYGIYTDIIKFIEQCALNTNAIPGRFAQYLFLSIAYRNDKNKQKEERELLKNYEIKDPKNVQYYRIIKINSHYIPYDDNMNDCRCNIKIFSNQFADICEEHEKELLYVYNNDEYFDKNKILKLYHKYKDELSDLREEIDGYY